MKKVMSLGLVAALLISMLTFITINVGAEAWDGVAAVSYTHLDVYKRQIYDITTNTAASIRKSGTN